MQSIQTEIRIDSSSTVNQVILRYPDSVAVFNAFGVDSCCGGDKTLSEAAAESGIDADKLTAALLDIAARSWALT